MTFQVFVWMFLICGVVMVWSSWKDLDKGVSKSIDDMKIYWLGFFRCLIGMGIGFWIVVVSIFYLKGDKL